MPAKKTKKEVQEELKKNGYSLIGEYEGSNYPITVKCEKGHIEERKRLSTITHDNVRCKECSGYKRKNSIEEVREKAKKNQLKLITKEYKDGKTKMSYECQNCNFQFSATWEKIQRSCKQGNNGCPECAKIKRTLNKRWTLEKVLSKIPKGVILLTKKEFYSIRKDRIKIKCKKEHVTEKSLKRFIETDFICTECFPSSTINKKDYLKLAERKNIKIINQAESSTKKSLWECRKGHKFEKSYGDVVITKEPCSECVGRKKWDLKKLASFFKLKKLILLDKSYKSGIKYKYKCMECGFKNSITLSNLRQGHGCPECAKKSLIRKQEKPKKDILNFVNSINYKLLMPLNEVKLKKKLELECDKGHKCHILYSNLVKGRRCVVCSGQYVNLDICKKEGSRIGLKLLPNQKYENQDQKMKWKCKDGHYVQVSYAEVKRRTYCPVCRPVDTLELDDLHPKFDLAMKKNKFLNLQPKLEFMKKYNINLGGKRPDRVILDPSTGLFMFVEMKHKDKKTFTKKQVAEQLETYNRIGSKHGDRFKGVLLVSSTGEYPNSISIKEAIKKIKNTFKNNKANHKIAS